METIESSLKQLKNQNFSNKIQHYCSATMGKYRKGYWQLAQKMIHYKTMRFVALLNKTYNKEVCIQGEGALPLVQLSINFIFTVGITEKKSHVFKRTYHKADLSRHHSQVV